MNKYRKPEELPNRLITESGIYLCGNRIRNEYCVKALGHKGVCKSKLNIWEIIKRSFTGRNYYEI